jgi:hypothetical protein
MEVAGLQVQVHEKKRGGFCLKNRSGMKQAGTDKDSLKPKRPRDLKACRQPTKNFGPLDRFFET